MTLTYYAPDFRTLLGDTWFVTFYILLDDSYPSGGYEEDFGPITGLASIKHAILWPYYSGVGACAGTWNSTGGTEGTIHIYGGSATAQDPLREMDTSEDLTGLGLRIEIYGK